MSQKAYFFNLKSHLRGCYIGCLLRFINLIYKPHIYCDSGILPNISCEGKDFVASWFPGLPLLSHPVGEVHQKGYDKFQTKLAIVL